MNQHKLLLIVSFFMIIILSLVSCSSETETYDESKLGKDFFPVETGKYWIYQSDSIIYRSGGVFRDTVRSFLKEEIGDSFVDLSGLKQYRVNRYFKRNIEDAWLYQNTWATYLDGSRAMRQEDNLKFIKLIFPFKKGSRWNGNQYLDTEINIEVGGEMLKNMYLNWNSRIESRDTLLTLAGKSYPSIIVNLVNDTTSNVDKKVVIESYGKNVGLVHKSVIILQDDSFSSEKPIEQRAKRGFFHQLILLDHN